MANYKQIKGSSIENRSSDPPAPYLGQLWYNTTTSNLKARFLSGGSWSTGSNSTNRYQLASGAGTSQDALLTCGSYEGPGSQCELYNGTNWTTLNSLNTGRGLTGAGGSSTSALVFGGNEGPGLQTEIWNGTNWTSTTDLPESTPYPQGCGTSSSAILATNGSSPKTWNGTSWTNQPTMPFNTNQKSLGGIWTSAWAQGGGSTQTDTDSWDGTSWTFAGNCNVGRYVHNGSGTSNTNGLQYGGTSPVTQTTDATEKWDGTSWSVAQTLNTASYLASAGGSMSASSVSKVGGNSDLGNPAMYFTEEFTAGILSANLPFAAD